MSARRPTRRAFTLVELALAVSIGAVLMLGILQLIRGGLRMFTATEETMESLQTAAVLSEIMQRDLRFMVLPVVSVPSDGSSPPPQALLPFKNWSGTGPQTGGNDVWDWGGPEDDDATPGQPLEPAFEFYRQNVSSGGSALFGLASESLHVDYQKVVYQAIPSERYGSSTLKVFVLKRSVYDVTMDSSGALTVSGTPSKENIYKSFYFRRLVLSLHQSPEDGLAPAGAVPAVTPPTTPGAPGALAALPPDQLYFVRAMVAGIAVGRVRQMGENAARGRNRQSIDLLVNLIHLDGVTDRFRQRSLATRWNPITQPAPAPGTSP